MPASKLTRAFCDAIKSDSGRQVSYADSEVRGLELRVSGDGRKSWSFRYRTRLGRQARISLGVHSTAFNVSEARAAARRCLVEVQSGEDPASRVRAARLQATLAPIKTFGDLAEAYFRATEAGRYRPKRKNSLSVEHSAYRLHIAPALAGFPLDELTRRIVKQALERLFDRGTPSAALRSQAVIRQILTYGVHEERIAFNPVRDLPPVAPSKIRDRIYRDPELAAIWAGVHAPERLRLPPQYAAKRSGDDRVMIGRPLQIALSLAMLLLQRRHEITGMRKSELDLDHAVWIIPADRMKSKVRHAVPLSHWAIALIREAIALNGEVETDYVFSSRFDRARPVQPTAMNYALAGVLWAQGIPDGRVHDLRRTGSTLMTSERLGISPFIRSKVLGHSDSGGGSRISSVHYDANSYLTEKRDALERWQALLARIVGLSRPAAEGFAAPAMTRVVCGPGRWWPATGDWRAPMVNWTRNSPPGGVDVLRRAQS